ncbi:heterokaryon incompatibility protein [Colletotrichum kahawae]|uniref:Heterokaryon incompatibility protein n=1 Tax=Colletotrichum kahawae TaxID=34407 RepID=A0AAD9YDZ9_COLKA|nr:heterokaryon incompatibility protein [Colletotrichum kahawae]
MRFKDTFEPSIQAQMKQNSPLHLYCDRPLEHFADLEDRYNWGDFVALSYVWGDQSRKKTILINGLPFEVGPSLHEALLSLQNSFEVKSRGLKVWIDAICINQEDLKERAREVQKMEMIYSEALVVRAWLGNPSPEVSAELNSVREMLNLAFHTEFNPVTRVNFEDEGITLQTAKPKTLPDFWELMAKDGNKAYATWTFIEEISQLSYWRRLWILQEVSLGSSFLFWYGDHYFSSEHIRVLLSESLWGRGRCFSTLSPYVDKERLQATAFSMIRIIRPIGSLRWDSEQPIVDVISRAKVANATDFRDKVYGILAFLPSTITRRIKPDYASDFSWKTCWTMFAKSCFEGFGNLDLLARSAGRGWTSLGIPTWAFDLSPSKSRYSRSHLAPGASGFYADDMENDPSPAIHAFESNKGLVATFQFSDDDSRLFCKGAFVDTVGAIATFGPETRGQAAALQNRNHVQSERLPGSDSRLELARVLKYDSNFKFGDGEEPFILDMPWISPDELFQTEVSPDDFKLDAYLYPESRHRFGVPWNIRTDQDLRGLPWAECYKQDTITRAFYEIFHPNELFELQGIPLKDFFTSIDEYCEDVPNFVEAVGSTYELLRWRRLFQTGNGFIGSITKHALPGDKIAIMYNCDTPVVLRPSKSGDTYEVVGGCFVEGYMEGELVENIKSGKLKTETLCLV